MSRINPLRRLYDDLTEKLSKDEVRRLRDLLSEDQITTREREDLKTPTDIFTKLEKSGQISETDLKLLKDLLEAIGRRPLVSDVERVEELQVWRMERVSDESKVKNTDMQSSVGGDVTPSSEISSAAVYREMTRTMKDPKGEPTSLQHHIDNHSLHCAQYMPGTNLQAKLQLQVQEQADDSADSPPSKHCEGSAESPWPAESKYPDVVLSCERDLKSLYIKLSKILPLPWWDGTNRLKLENIYTELELETKTKEEGDKVNFQSGSNSQHTASSHQAKKLQTEPLGQIPTHEKEWFNKRDFPTQEIFKSKKDEEGQKTPKRVLIEGDPGYGKSTFCKKLIYDWAKGDTEYLNHFKLIFHFELRHLLYSNAQNVQDAIFSQLLRAVRDESKRVELWNFVQSNQEKVCFVFDGLDEVHAKDLPSYFVELIAVNCLLPDCPVIVTSRKIRDKNAKQMYDTQLSIKGFDYEKAVLFSKKHIEKMNSEFLQTKVKASDFLQELEKSYHKGVLIDFMQSPLNTLMLCDIWIHSNKLPNTRTKLYEEIIDYVVKRYRESHDCDSHFEEEIKEALSLMGEMSYWGLTTDERNVYFSDEDISHNRYIRELGLMTKVSEFPSRYGFYHLTFQEYFAAMYVAHLLTNDRCKFIDAITLLSKGRSLRESDTLFAFIGGKLQKNVDEIFKAMKEKGILLECIFPHKYSSFDPRQILYESCCTSTAVFEHCAEFLPENFTVDLNKMVCHSDSSRLDVNTAILQCPRIRSKRVRLKLSAVNAHTVAMYRKCYEALQKNGKTFETIDVGLTVDLNDCSGKGVDYHENFSFINNTQHPSLPDVKPLNISSIGIEICERVTSPIAFTDCHITTIIKSLSLVSADSLSICGLPPGNLDLMRKVLNYLNSNKLIKSFFVIFDKIPNDKWCKQTLNITAYFGKFVIKYNSNMIEFDLADLHSLLSTFTDVENESVLLCVLIWYDPRENTDSDMADILRRVQSADLESLQFITSPKDLDGQNYSLRDTWLNKEDMYASILNTVKELSRVSSKELYILELPLGNMEFMKYVLGCLRNSQGLGLVFLTFHDDCNDTSRFSALNMKVIFGNFKIYYDMNTMDFKLAELDDFFSRSISGNETVLPDVVLTLNLQDERKLDIAEVLSKLESVEIGELLLIINLFFVSDLKRDDLNFIVVGMVKALSRVSFNVLYIGDLPVGNLEFMINVLGCLSCCKLLKTVHVAFRDDGFQSPKTGKIEIHARFGKFHLLWKINDMHFNLLRLHQSVTECLSLDSNDVIFSVTLSYDLNKSTNTELTEIFEKFLSVDIAKMSLHMSYISIGDIDIDIDSHTFDMIQNLSLINAKSFVIKGLPYKDVEFIKSVHTDLEKSLPDKETYISFGPSYCPVCDLLISEHTTLISTNQKHISKFVLICKSKLDIVSLYQELYEELSTHGQRFLMDAQIGCTSNIENDIQYILDGSKSIKFNKIEYVEGLRNRSPAIDVLEKLAEVNTKQVSYKSNEFIGYESTKSVVDALLQCQSAIKVVISSEKQCDDIEISDNIEKLVSDGIIIQGIKLFGTKLAVQGTYVEGVNTLSKVIEVEFTFHLKSNIGFIYDNTEESHIILDNSNAFTNMHIKIFDGLQTKSELKYLCIELFDLLPALFQTFHQCESIIENILDCVLALHYLTNVTIVGGKIISTDNSLEKWIDLCSKESLQMLTFEGCDLNSSCQSMIDSFSKADERRCSQLRIILSDSLCLQNMNLMKDLLMSKSFGLNDACGSDSQGEIVFSLKGKSVSIFASSCANL